LRWLLLEENENDLNKEEYNNDDLEHSIYTDDLEKKIIDRRRMKKEDFSKKRAAVESVFDERTYFQLNKLIKNGPLDKIEGIISAGKEANVYLAYDRMGNEVAVKIYKIDRNTSRWMKTILLEIPDLRKFQKMLQRSSFYGQVKSTRI